ncbi:hypothetical protein SASPL_135184 [Salvia splendens]|uniref:Uncharacterized protein n=1 Tax=Salvia splendens TaxID=180675 RepID=A0A8X8WZ52_SALSN|nr:hypothetical protein SASPL_135184 [Salvia splendens]
MRVSLQSVELTSEAVEFLKGIFSTFDDDKWALMTLLASTVMQHQPYSGNKKTLILQEIPEDGVKKLLSKNESLGACDVAVFVDDRLGYFATYQEFSQVVKSYHD